MGGESKWGLRFIREPLLRGEWNRRTKQEQRPSSLGLCLARRRKTIVKALLRVLAPQMCLERGWAGEMSDRVSDIAGESAIGTHPYTEMDFCSDMRGWGVGDRG